MPDSKITALASTGTGTDPANDPLVIVDVSDTSMAATGTTKKVTLNQLLACSPSATLASATITGDLTVDTNVLKVDTTNNRVGIGTASPANVLTVRASDTFVLSTGGSTGFTGYSAQVDSGAGTSLGAFANSFGWVGTSTNHYLEIRANNIAQQKIEPLGIFSWFDGAGGTRMTLNSTGLGVGGSPAAKLDVNGNVIIRDTFNLTMGFGNQQRILAGGGSDNTYLTFSQWTGAAYTERMRIDQSGNLGISVTPSAWGGTAKAIQIGSYSGIYNDVDFTVVVNNAFFNGTNNIYRNTAPASQYYQQAGSHVWRTAPSGTAGNAITYTQAMTLDASGNLLVGKTSIGTTVGIEVRPDGYLVATRSATTDGAGFTNAVYSSGAAAYRFYVGMGGTVFATNTTISGISDARLKENVQDLDVGLGAILALKPRKFDWKAGKGKDIKGDRGFIAQEFETVFPQLVDEWADPAPEGEAPYKSVRQDLIPVLVKAIQELTARVQTLEAK